MKLFLQWILITACFSKGRSAIFVIKNYKCNSVVNKYEKLGDSTREIIVNFPYFLLFSIGLYLA